MRRVQQVVQFCFTSAASDESGPVSRGQMRPDDLRTFDNVPNYQQFGFASALPVGSQVVRLCALGDSTSGVGVASLHAESRPRGLTPGQSVQHDQIGSRVFLPSDNTIQAIATSSVTAQTPMLKAAGNLKSGTGCTGSFTTPTGNVVTVQDGIITNIF